MKLAGLLLLLAGWVLAIAAVVLLPTVPSQSGFVLAGIAVQILGFVLVARSHLPAQRKINAS